MIIAGIDEVGRGSWAGPLVAAAVILERHLPGLRDSKVLSAAKRIELATQIEAHGNVGIGWVESAEVDALGLTEAVRTAMCRALEGLPDMYDQLVIDGNYNFFPDNDRAQAVIRADGTIDCVSAASIIAKVARDTYMQTTAHEQFPEYGFANNVGYGTAAHTAALRQHGITALHRLSYKPIRAIAEIMP
jgi:ribonuclease HII